MLYTWDVFYEEADGNALRQWIGIVEADTQSQAIRQAAQLYERPDHDLIAQRTPKQKRPDFDPNEALARYRELEGLLNLELINTPQWQARRAQGDTSFLLTSRHFQEQERLLEEIEANGYDIFDRATDDDEGTIYEIEPIEE